MAGVSTSLVQKKTPGIFFYTLENFTFKTRSIMRTLYARTTNERRGFR